MKKSALVVAAVLLVIAVALIAVSGIKHTATGIMPLALSSQVVRIRGTKFTVDLSDIPTTTIDGDRFYVVEGDELLDRDETLVYLATKQRTGAPFAPTGLSVGQDLNGELERWPTDRIRYAVLKSTLGSEYERVVTDLRSAARAWEETCNIRFEHVDAFDSLRASADLPAEIDFVARRMTMASTYVATAFYPSWSPERRRLFLYPSYFSRRLAYDRVGVLRHELGHVLGFRHEHVRVDATFECEHETEDTDGVRNLTPYDSSSVMHYVCKDVGDPTFAITDTDRRGAQLVYGAPAPPVLVDAPSPDRTQDTSL